MDKFKVRVGIKWLMSDFSLSLHKECAGVFSECDRDCITEEIIELVDIGDSFEFITVSDECESEQMDKTQENEPRIRSIEKGSGEDSRFFHTNPEWSNFTFVNEIK